MLKHRDNYSLISELLQIASATKVVLQVAASPKVESLVIPIKTRKVPLFSSLALFMQALPIPVPVKRLQFKCSPDSWARRICPNRLDSSISYLWAPIAHRAYLLAKRLRPSPPYLHDIQLHNAESVSACQSPTQPQQFRTLSHMDSCSTPNEYYPHLPRSKLGCSAFLKPEAVGSECAHGKSTSR
jgi:hypothetical protein